MSNKNMINNMSKARSDLPDKGQGKEPDTTKNDTLPLFGTIKINFSNEMMSDEIKQLTIEPISSITLADMAESKEALELLVRPSNLNIEKRTPLIGNIPQREEMLSELMRKYAMNT